MSEHSRLPVVMPGRGLQDLALNFPDALAEALFAQRLPPAAVDVEEVSRFLDHSSLAVTTTYLRRLEGQQDRGWARVAEAIGVWVSSVVSPVIIQARFRWSVQSCLSQSHDSP